MHRELTWRHQINVAQGKFFRTRTKWKPTQIFLIHRTSLNMQINVDNEYEITTCNRKSLFTSIVVFAQQMQIRIQN
jgi:hypothetical protein